MVKRSITYKDLDGEPVTEVLYFNLNLAEIVELELSEKDGLDATLKELIKTEDGARIMVLIKRMILWSYGVREGNKLRKNDQIRDDFVDTGAYSALFVEMVTDQDKAAAFINSIVNPQVLEEATRIAQQQRLVQVTPDLEKVQPRFMTRSELEGLDLDDYKEAIDKIATGEIVINTDIPD